jgi:SAM-dependent methyltransferase
VPICEGRTVFYKEGTWLRDQYLCYRCKSIPRWRSLIYVMENYVQDWRDLAIHESSPCGPASNKISRECRHYVPTHYFADVKPGSYKNNYRSEDLEAQTFPDESFDIVITQDVIEHVFEPRKAFREIHRTLKPGGCHLFTVPWVYWKETVTRAIREGSEIRHLLPPDYHGNPIDATGSLVVTEWGRDLCDFIYDACGMTTTVMRIIDRHKGIEAEFNEIFISRKPS